MKETPLNIPNRVLGFELGKLMAGWSMIGDDKCGPEKKTGCSVDVVPPMLGDGKRVDLVKLFLVVREKGGYNAVSEKGLWGVVTEECGLAVTLSPFVKLVYVKYLDTLQKGLEEIDGKDSITNLSDSDSILRKVSIELGPVLSGIPKWNVLNTSTEMDSDGSEKYPVDDEESVHIGHGGAGNVGSQENLQSNVVVDTDRGKKCVNDDEIEETISSRKRKRESISRMLNWITGVASSPCDNVVDPIPESSKWESYGNEEMWRQILRVREALFMKSNVDSGGEQSAAKNRKMHPCLYDDQAGSAYNFRERQKVSKKFVVGKTPAKAQARSQLTSSKTRTDSGSCTKGSSDGGSSTETAPVDLPVEKVIPLGPDFQADVPEWTGVVSQSDSKWLGRRDWPLAKVDNRLIVEREPIGKGRQDSCGCEVPKSVDCVRFHVAERRLRIKREMGVAFYHWRFDKMGEDVRLGWTADEEKKFKAIVQSNPASEDKCFWDEIIKYFSTKKREVIVSYYFNVFLLQRRAQQNRVTPKNIDSDDDEESACGSVTPSSRLKAPMSPGSLLYFGKKSHKKAK
ncbi:AT-rich interactive domain-containing protein 1 isoform X2 [Euphorbia lathyris]|uniref:AT-rich interactive domain-containing protein 1 isoform X2 n=1 Tax=Euphorbia lathyris TaxID=212925 RepID=UPI00331346C5